MTTTGRLRLEPITAAHAPAMCAVLADPALYTVIGGQPPDLASLTRRYAALAGQRSPDGTQAWLNWAVLLRAGGAAVGTVQATVVAEGGRLVAELAWIVGVRHQGNGYAREAAGAVRGWLAARGVDRFRAHIHPGHAASARVAAAIGLAPSEQWQDGERRWVG